jgi:signal transduction histidine kinase
LADPRSLGLLGMRERAALLGGEAVIRPATTRGTVLSVQVPTQFSTNGYASS